MTTIRADKRPLVLSKVMTVGPGDNWLTVDTRVLPEADSSRPAAVLLRIDTKEIGSEKTPLLRSPQGPQAAQVFAIEPFRRKKVTLELTQPAGGPGLFWQALGVSDELPEEYRFDRALRRALALRDAKPLPAKWARGARDLLKAVDPEKDAIHRRWTKADGQIISGRRVFARCQLPEVPQGSYQLETQFTRMAGDCMAVMFPVGQTGALLVVSGWAGEISGLAFIGGKDANDNATTRDGKLTNGVKHTVLITTRLLEGDRARIEVTLDGKPYITWEGLLSALAPDRDWRLRAPKGFGLGAYEATIIFHSCRVRTIDDKAKTGR